MTSFVSRSYSVLFQNLIKYLKLLFRCHGESSVIWFVFSSWKRYIDPYVEDSTCQECSYPRMWYADVSTIMWDKHCHVSVVCQFIYLTFLFCVVYSIEECGMLVLFKLGTDAKTRNRFNQVPHLTNDTVWESDEYTNYITHRRAKKSALSQQVNTMLHYTDMTI